MKIVFEGKPTHKTLKFSGSVKALFKKLKVEDNTALIARSGTLLTVDDNLKDSDEVLIMSVISGG